MRSKAEKVALTAGEAVHIQTPGGGGFGDPLTRPRDAVATDIRQGLVSETTARTHYGYTA